MKEKRKLKGRAEVFNLPEGWKIKPGFVVTDDKGNFKGCSTDKGVALLMAAKSIAYMKVFFPNTRQ